MPSDGSFAAKGYKVQCRVTSLSPMKTSKDKSYFDDVHIDTRVIHHVVHRRLYDRVCIVIAHGNVNNSAAAARAVELGTARAHRVQ